MDDLFAVFEENKHDEEDIEIEKPEKPKKRTLDEAQSAEEVEVGKESSKRTKIDGAEEVQEEVREQNVRTKTQRVQIDEFR